MFLRRTVLSGFRWVLANVGHFGFGNRDERRALYLLRVAVLLVLVVLLVRLYALQAFVIVSDSMAPTLVPGDYLLLEKLSYRFGVPRRFDVVVARVAALGFLTKRLVGFPGETVSMRGGRLQIDGEALAAEPWTTGAGRLLGHWDFGPVVTPRRGDALVFRGGVPYLAGEPACRCTGVEVSFYERLLPPGVLAGDGQVFYVREDQYFVLGDNRGDSLDSRFLGFVPQSEIEGRVWLVYWSKRHGDLLPRFGRLGPLAD